MSIAATSGDEARRREHKRLHFRNPVPRIARCFFGPCLSTCFSVGHYFRLFGRTGRKAQNEFEQSRENMGHVRLWIKGFADVVKPVTVVEVVDDPDDNKVVECAIAGAAKSIVTGDRDLHRLRKFVEITILTIHQFMDTLPRPSPQ
jgi:hypothetical protein